MRLPHCIALALAAACAGSKSPERNAVPQVGAQALSPDNSETEAIVIAAAKSLDGRSGFTGVHFDGRRHGPLSESVLRATTLSRVDADGGRVPFAVAKMTGPGPVPTSAAIGNPVAIISIVSVRAGLDSAYVGTNDMRKPGQNTGGCIVLARNANAWTVVRTAGIQNGVSCGK